jgi:hypothetical protein
MTEGGQPAVRLALMAAGFTPVTLVAATAFGVSDLRALATYVLLPMVAVVAILMAAHREARRLLAVAVVTGVLATGVYDAYRFAFLASGLMHRDPIPHIGAALHLHPDWVFGYLWRYLGNGTGLALAFVAAGFRGVRAGLCYGLFVCAGLILTLAVAPYGQQMLFELSPITLVMAIGGHLLYGAVLGLLTPQPASPGAFSGRR